MRNASLSLLLAIASCSRVTYVDRTTTPSGKVATEKGHFFVAGLVGHADLAAYEHCPDGVSRIQSKFTASDLVLSLFTLGIYAPRTYRIECGR